MKKIISILMLIILVSCSKTNPINQSNTNRVFIRIESVEPDGKSTYSPISTVLMK
jgi:hypothetical protein